MWAKAQGNRTNTGDKPVAFLKFFLFGIDEEHLKNLGIPYVIYLSYIICGPTLTVRVLLSLHAHIHAFPWFYFTVEIPEKFKSLSGATELLSLKVSKL